MNEPRFRLTNLLAGVAILPAIKGHLYLDPGSGSFILQVLIAGAAGMVFILRHQIARFFGMFTRKKENAAKPASKKPLTTKSATKKTSRRNAK